MPLPTRLAYVLRPTTQGRLGATCIGSALRGRYKTVKQPKLSRFGRAASARSCHENLPLTMAEQVN
ncbi:hypothetical protein Pyn_00052 [Prunus yedoensis var. nudiflora]|uniref:Uncharacterized protein n=1 Tax=Prunus yedoensis var. nudiflora TaxID=2094558 RepID=A0A314Z9M5_PRUYE|nr:hypothetical protein Pyn_00052 [Prunus yedoensis var. nudiflora]